jgi:hypothetical protein
MRITLAVTQASDIDLRQSVLRWPIYVETHGRLRQTTLEE